MTPAAPLRVIVLIGLPGCGKSTWAKSSDAGVLSSDAIRKLLADDETDQSIHSRVFSTLRYLLRQRLAIGRAVTCIDATNLTRAERRPYVEIARAYGARVEAVYFDVPLELCRERNARRHRVVPDRALLAMSRKLTPPTLDEGLAHITVLGGSGDSA